MDTTVFTQREFDVFAIGTTAVPVLIAGFACLGERRRPRVRIVLGLLLLAMAGLDLRLMRGLARSALQTPSPLDDRVFSGDLAVVFYVVIALIGLHAFRMLRLGIVEHRTEVALVRDGRVAGAFWSA